MSSQAPSLMSEKLSKLRVMKPKMHGLGMLCGLAIVGIVLVQIEENEKTKQCQLYIQSDLII